MNKRLFSAFLAALLLLTSFAGCSEQTVTDEGTKTPEQNVSEDEIVVEEEKDVTANLAEADYNAYEFVMLSHEAKTAWGELSLDADEMTGEVLNDAIFTRNTAIEDRYNITIVDQPSASPVNDVRNSVTAGGDDYDIFLDYVKLVLADAPNGYYYNLLNINSIDLSNPWWNTECVDLLTLYNKLFVGFNCFNTNIMAQLCCTLCNLDLITNFGLESPYDLVRENRWTLDKMYDMAHDISNDLNGDGIMDVNDQYGYITGVGSYNCLMVSCKQPSARISEEGKIEMNFDSDRAYAAVEKIARLINDKNFAVYLNTDSWGYQVFSSGNGLFEESTIGNLKAFRETDMQITSIPEPKFDEQQDNYYTLMSNCSLGITVPTTNSDVERTGVICEALGAYSLTPIREAYYEITLKCKLANDVDTTEMLEIIVNSQTADLGIFYENIFQTTLANFLSNSRQSGDINIASSVAKKQKPFDKQSQKLYEQYEKLN